MIASAEGRFRTTATANTIADEMPIYEFECEACGERCEALVEIGTETIDCRHCGSPKTRRVLSAQAPSMRLVRSRGDARKQESKNASLHKATKAKFSKDMAKRRSKRKGNPG